MFVHAFLDELTGYVTCDAPGCTAQAALLDDDWRWNPEDQLPPGWHGQTIAGGRALHFTYCPSHRFTYRGCTPTGRRCAPPRRSGYRARTRLRGLRAYSRQRQPCRCGAHATNLTAFFGARWRIPTPAGHIQPGACPRCGGALHVDADSAHCPACGYADVVADPPTYLDSLDTQP